jgi:Mn-dependent DtxR family transcriptional regulator
MKLGVMEIRTLYRAAKLGWYKGWCPATCERMERKGLITINGRDKIVLTDLGLAELANCQEILASWGWT